MGRLLPGRRQAAPGGAHRPAARAGLPVAGIEDWLFDESYQAVGDLAETIALVLPQRAAPARSAWPNGWSSACCRCAGCRRLEQAERVAAYWHELDSAGRFLLVKLIGGAFRVGVSKLLVQRALAEDAGIDAKLVAQRMMGYTDMRGTAQRGALPGAHLAEPAAATDAGQPYPFFLAHALEQPLERFDAAIGATRRLAGRMEVRRHPRPGRQARRPGVDLVARRRAGHRALSRGGGAGAAAARRHGARRRDPGVEGRRARRPSPCCSSASAARR